MNNTIKELYNRKSVRVFTDEAITEEERFHILNSALQAPSAGNMEMYTIIDVQNQEIKDKLAVLCDNQPFIAQAKLVLIFLADYQKWYDIFKDCEGECEDLEESDLFLAMNDSLIAAQNTVVAAESMGIGSCYIGDILENYEQIQEMFNLPQYAVPCTMLVFGRPTQQQKERVKPTRFALEDMVHVDSYKQKTAEETRNMFKKQTGKEDDELLNKYIHAFAKRKFKTGFRHEMNRSVRAIIKHWTKK